MLASFLTFTRTPQWRSIMEFVLCFLALQASYLTWGLMQELIMNTQFTPTPSVPSGRFPSATFCVFSNRFLALIVSAAMCYRYHGTVLSSAPLTAFTPCAISNTVSSWSQYKALEYVSFNLQTLFKSTKVIPVMLMGYFLKGTTYSMIEYLEAIAITVGVSAYSFAQVSDSSSHSATKAVDVSETTFSGDVEFFGFTLLCAYVLSDSFTAQWQSRVYRDYGKIDHYHMMFGVNVSSIIITTVALVFSGELFPVMEFLAVNPLALWYNILTAITSTTGQIAIYYTIRQFGPVVFTIIMTTRQMMSMVLSTLVFGHSIGWTSLFGAVIVFGAVFHSIYRQTNAAHKASKQGALSASTSSSSSAGSSNVASSGVTGTATEMRVEIETSKSDDANDDSNSNVLIDERNNLKISKI